MSAIDLLRSLSKGKRRVEGDGFIRWYVGNDCVVEVTQHAYYQDGHVHPKDCDCPALIHNYAFRERLRTAFEEA